MKNNGYLIGDPQRVAGVRPPLLSFKEACAEFSLTHGALSGILRSNDAPRVVRPRFTPKSKGGSYYNAAELRKFVKAWKEKQNAKVQ